MSYLEDMIRRLEEIADIKELNLKLMQALHNILFYIIDYAETKDISLDDTENLSHLMEQVTAFMNRVYPSPSFLVNKQKSDDDDPPTDKFTEPVPRRLESTYKLRICMRFHSLQDYGSVEN